ncbi:endopeptidase La [Caviibacter abscessus]|uniref:endopeptidase La n=1 Tax=Caviibacter abscessus TaxID=1766719 RepID=UPI00083137E2|nr:endopeptidase La [Caviibacter abscessus]
MIPVLPLKEIVSMPGVVSSIYVGRQISINSLLKANSSNGEIVLLLQKEQKKEEINVFNDLEEYGVLAKIQSTTTNEDKTYKVIIKGTQRIKVKKISYNKKDDVYYAEVVKVRTKKIDLNDSYFTKESIIDKAKEYLRSIDIELTNKIELNDDIIENILYLYIQRFPFSSKEKQKFLEINDLKQRIQYFYDLIDKNKGKVKIDREIETKVQASMSEAQKAYYLREKLKIIKDELGDEYNEGDSLEKLEKINNSKMPEKFKEKLRKELSKIKKLPDFSQEYNVISNYIDVVLELPFEESKKEPIDISKSKEILDEYHYGLKEVKDTILEYLSVLELKERKKDINNDEKFSTILCLVGPPGVGKTSFASSIAKAMNRKFTKISLGGVNDESEIRGHRRTYVGAMPGRIIDAMKRVGVTNPVILLDEIDKLDSNFKGDPASALLEVLDPSQNRKFEDHFIDFPYDLSNVLFICTANNYQGIPAPLYDRLEVIELDSYTEIEKLNIAKKHLISQVKNETAVDINLSDSVILKIINSYTREAGVRNLKREISKLFRKIARKMLEYKNNSKINVNTKNLADYLGPEKFKPEKIALKKEKVGIVNGLAWTAVGGTTLEVQAVKMQGSGQLLLTGKLGEVMQESAKVSYSYVRSIKDLLKIKEEFNKTVDVHLHFPEGAVPKDGPSAGITITTAIISVLSGLKVRQDIAMTGEITITGEVLPVGGIKEKVIAAHRIGIREVILPFENKVDTEILPKEIIKDMKFNFVKNYSEVLKLAFLQ